MNGADTPAAPARTVHTRITGVAAHLPERTLTTAQLEDRIAADNPGLDFPRGLIAKYSGVQRRHVAAAAQRPSDLAVTAAGKLLKRTGTDPAQVDLLLYAGLSLDFVEPATAHLVACELGMNCPVFETRNACNSVCNAIEAADAFIAMGRYRTVLIVSGETGTRTMPRVLDDEAAFTEAVASYTVSDAGVALLLEAGEEPGLLTHHTLARSSAWPAATVPIIYRDGDIRIGSFTVDGTRLAQAFITIERDRFTGVLTGMGLAWDDLTAVCMHQASLDSTWKFCEYFGVPKDKVVVTIADHGNVATASLPLQLAQATAAGRVRGGDLVALIGLASGVSVSFMVLRW